MLANSVDYSSSATRVVVSPLVKGTNNFTAFDQLLAVQPQKSLPTNNTFNTITQSSANDNFQLSTELLDLNSSVLAILNGVNNNAARASVSTTLEEESSDQQLASTNEETLQIANNNPEQISIEQLLNAYAYTYQPGLSIQEELSGNEISAELLDA